MVRNNQNGFSMIELMIAMALFVVVIVSATNVFTPILTTHKQQSKISETYIEGVVGLDIMRRDIEHAGIGLAWDLDGTTYVEAVNDAATTQDETGYNDSAANVPPRKLVSGDGDGAGGSDVVVIKSVLVANNEASQKWTHVNDGNINQEWDPDHERFDTGDRVIVIVPGVNRKLVRNAAGAFFTTYTNNGASAIDDRIGGGTSFLPSEPDRHYIVYGINTNSGPALRMPFNRADFYIRSPGTMPQRCAAGTGILYKGTVSHNGGGLNELPLLDCVASMQVAYGYDSDDNDDTDLVYTDDISLAPASMTTAENVRTVKQVRVYVLAQEGQRDPGFTFANNTMNVGETITTTTPPVAYIVGDSAFDMTTITDWAQYRWKLYILAIDLSG